MRIVKARMADRISPQLQAHLRLLHSVPVFVLAPVSGAALAFGLDAVGVWVLGELAPGTTEAAAAVGLHDDLHCNNYHLELSSAKHNHYVNTDFNMPPIDLQKDDRGRALASLIAEYGSNAELARATGFRRDAVGMWVQRGYISRRAAYTLEEVTGRMKEEFRPDLTAEEWAREFAGPVPGQPPVVTTQDAKLLVQLATQFGSVKALCAAAFITVSDYHTYKSRGRIPAIKLPTLLSLQK